MTKVLDFALTTDVMHASASVAYLAVVAAALVASLPDAGVKRCSMEYLSGHVSVVSFLAVATAPPLLLLSQAF